MASKSVTTSISFLQPNDLFSSEKPYAFRYGVDGGEVPQSNMVMKEIHDINITDIRGHEAAFTLEKQGFEVIQLESKLTRDDFFTPEKLPMYFAELESLLTKRLNASKVKIFRHGIRQRHPGFPLSTGKAYEYDQPTSVAHVDTTPREMLEEVLRQKLSDVSSTKVEWINIWKPLRGPLNDWPLTLCDAATVDSASGLEAADLLYPDLATENFQVYHSQKHKWYYLSSHSPEELIVFRQAGVSADGVLDRYSVPHCSFPNPYTAENEPPRESIEARALVFHD